MLAQQLNTDINNRDDTSEPRAIAQTEEALLRRFGRQRPDTIRRARQDFWNNNYLRMEQLQTQWTASNGQAKQDLWGDYVAASRLGPLWQAYIQQCRGTRSVASVAAVDGQAPPPPYMVAVGAGQQLQQPVGVGAGQQQQQPVGVDQQPQQPLYHQYASPSYYQGGIAPVGSSYGGGAGSYSGQYPNSGGCCSII
jgi:hypothetical protein